ncbi:MAG: hypothetical protein ACPL28_10250 [bacterium]
MTDIFLNNEKAIYNIKFFEDTKRITEIGKLMTTFRKESDIEITNETVVYPQNTKERAIIYLSKFDFRPLLYESYITTPAGDITIKGEYQQKCVIATILTKRETKKIKIDIDDNTYDNASAFYIFRLIPFGILPVKRLYLVNLNIGQRFLIEVEKIEDTIKCGFGRFDCAGVKMVLCDYPKFPTQKFFYKKDEPHYLIKNIAGRQVMELEQIGGEYGTL